MPFTIAHPAIILPFLRINRKYISATGLIAGSVSPDFEYFLKFKVNSEFSHTLLGIFWFDLPVALLISLAFHGIVKRNLLVNIPAFVSDRVDELKQLNFTSCLRQYPLAFGMSAVAGAASHIFWDGFTHSDGFFVRNLAFYENAYIPLDGVRYPLWYALQHLSTYVGLTIIAIYVLLLPRNTSPSDKYWIGYWPVVFMVAAASVSIRFLISPGYEVGNFVVSSISGLCIGLIVAGLKFKI